jgi:NAD(P)-dependent dehydrogenase (short-subunit alcohol dehydrogenase family)
MTATTIATPIASLQPDARGREAADALGARWVALDVTDDASVAAAAETLAAAGGLDVLVLGIVRVTHAFLPLLRQSPNPVIVNVSSGMGSVTLTTQYAKALPELRVNAVDPGYTGTDFNDDRGPQTVQEGTDAIVAMAQIGPDGPTGTYTHRHGVVPW